MEELNLQLKQIRKMRRMSQGDLAEAVGVSSRVISAWERQETAGRAFESRRRHQKPKVDGLPSTFFVKIFISCLHFASKLYGYCKSRIPVRIKVLTI